MRRSMLLAAGIGLTAIGGAAMAHHGDAGRFEDEISTITGSVVALQLINPHSGILVSVPDANGKPVTWHVEMEAPQRLQKEFGWNRATLKPGTMITVSGRRIKSGAPDINVTERSRILLTENCEEIYHSRDLEPLTEKPATCK
jgi:Family of unknown function (DUF6152)